jgi:Alkylmercury lyase
LITRLTAADQVVRTAAFREILATGQPWDPASAAHLGIDLASVRAGVRHLVASGRARTDDEGRVISAAGLSTDPTNHRVLVGFDPRWTNCAYDALGILGALGADGVIATHSPSGTELHVLFEGGRPVGSDAVLFLADQPCCSRPNEDWCPNVNLFEHRSSAERWSKEHGVEGRVVTLEEGTDLGVSEWRPLVEGYPWPKEGPGSRDPGRDGAR